MHECMKTWIYWSVYRCTSGLMETWADGNMDNRANVPDGKRHTHTQRSAAQRDFPRRTTGGPDAPPPAAHDVRREGHGARPARRAERSRLEPMATDRSDELKERASAAAEGRTPRAERATSRSNRERGRAARAEATRSEAGSLKLLHVRGAPERPAGTRIAQLGRGSLPTAPSFAAGLKAESQVDLGSGRQTSAPVAAHSSP